MPQWHLARHSTKGQSAPMPSDNFDQPVANLRFFDKDKALVLGNQWHRFAQDNGWSRYPNGGQLGQKAFIEDDEIWGETPNFGDQVKRIGSLGYHLNAPFGLE
jgi:hypothetical protein